MDAGRCSKSHKGNLDVKQQPKFTIPNSVMAGNRPRGTVRRAKVLLESFCLFLCSCSQVKLKTFKTSFCHFLTWNKALLSYTQSFQLCLSTQSLKNTVIIYTVIIPSTLINIISQWVHINLEWWQGLKRINTPPFLSVSFSLPPWLQTDLITAANTTVNCHHLHLFIL